jgi:hypothetical protein
MIEAYGADTASSMTLASEVLSAIVLLLQTWGAEEEIAHASISVLLGAVLDPT